MDKIRTHGTGHLYKRKGSRVWWAQFRVRGKRHRRSTRETSRKKAEAVLRGWLQDLDTGKYTPAKAATLTVNKALSDLETHYEVNGRRSLRRLEDGNEHLRAFFGPKLRAVDVTTADLEQYVAARLKVAAPATCNYELAMLRRALRLKAKTGVLRRIPHFPMLSLDNARKGFVEEGDLRALLANLPEDVAPVVEFGFWTGWRIRSEVVPLTWDRVDFAAGTVHLYDSKNRSGRTFPFDAVPRLQEILKEQRKRSTGTAVFPITYKKVLRAWRTACEEAKFGEWVQTEKGRKWDGLILHDLRRSAVRNVERAGVPRSIAMQLTGHKTEAVYRRYDIVDEADLRDGAARLAAHLGQQRAQHGPQFGPQSAAEMRLVK